MIDGERARQDSVTRELIGNSAVHKSEFWQQAARAPHVWSTSDCMTESLHPVPQLTGFLALLSSSSWPLGNSCSNEPASSLKRPTSSQFFRKRVGVGVWSGIESEKPRDHCFLMQDMDNINSAKQLNGCMQQYKPNLLTI